MAETNENLDGNAEIAAEVPLIIDLIARTSHWNPQRWWTFNAYPKSD